MDEAVDHSDKHDGRESSHDHVVEDHNSPQLKSFSLLHPSFPLSLSAPLNVSKTKTKSEREREREEDKLFESEDQEQIGKGSSDRDGPVGKEGLKKKTKEINQ